MEQKLSPSASSSIVHRPRHSPWPAIPMEQAWQIVDEHIGAILASQLRETELKATNAPELLGSVLAEPMHAMVPVPAFRASIKDGYAVIASDGAGRRQLIASSTAVKTGADDGAEWPLLQHGQCVRITTGARVPPGADAVVQVEDTRVLEHNEEEELMIEIGKEPRQGQDIREVGSDVAKDELLLDKGTVLNAAEIGLVALSGRDKILVFKRPHVSVMSTGDELIDFYTSSSLDNPDHNGAVMDTNRPVLISLIRSAGFEPVDCGIIGDSLTTLVETTRKALSSTDVLVVTGGVSMGEKDLLKEVLAHHLGLQVHFGRVFMKPGLPTTFASGIVGCRNKFVFALPGNPVSAFVTAHLFVLPQLRRISGIDNDDQWRNARIRVKLAHPITSLDTRPEYRRAVFIRNQIACGDKNVENVPLAECVQGSQMSSRLSSTRSANLLLELPAKTENRVGFEAGELVTALIIGHL